MEEQQLLTDLAIAEKNLRGRMKINRPVYADRLMDAFREYSVHSFMDLVEADINKAVELRDLARVENLL